MGIVRKTLLICFLLGVVALVILTWGSLGSAVLTLGLLLGVLEIFCNAYISQELSNAIVFGVLIIVLLVRPTGLLGKPIREKV